MKKGVFLMISVMLCLAMLLPACTAPSETGEPETSDNGENADWPVQPINIVVGFAAGGNTDMIPRTLAPKLEEALGVSVTVSNMTGGTGGVAADFVSQSPHDGYTILQAPESLRILQVMGYHDSKIGEDWDILMSSISNSCIVVRKDSEFKDFGQLLDYVRQNPNELKISASSIGTMWHVQSQVLAKNYDFQLEYIPYQGSTPAQTALLSGEVDVCLSGIGEIGELLRSGDVIPLCTFNDTSYNMEGVGEMPPITDWIPEVKSILPFGSWQALVVPMDTPQYIKDRIEEVFLDACQSQEFKDFVKMREGEVMGWNYEQSNELGIHQMNRDSFLVYELGLTQNNPEAMGFVKPE